MAEAAPGVGRKGTLHLTYPRGALLNDGRYRVEYQLNKGATAVVYAATDLQDERQRQVALKVMLCGPNRVPIQVVRREITLSSAIAHENMVKLLDVFAEGDSALIIVWELIAGPDLLDLLNESGGRMTEEAAAFYFVQLLRAVLHMHAAGFCHRDIKPENCMVERATQRLKLIDFGLSKHLESVATLGVGTPDYMPPEMLRSAKRPTPSFQHLPHQAGPTFAPPTPPTPAAVAGPAGPLGAPSGPPTYHQQQQQAPPYDAKAVDAWAMGVVLYLLLTGTYPFEDPAHPASLAATVRNVLEGRMRPLPPGLSSECRDLITGLLQTDPGRRTQLGDLASHSWLMGKASTHASALGVSRYFNRGIAALLLPARGAALTPATHTDPTTAPTSSNSQSKAAATSSSSGGMAGPSSFIPTTPTSSSRPGAPLASTHGYSNSTHTTQQPTPHRDPQQQSSLGSSWGMAHTGQLPPPQVQQAQQHQSQPQQQPQPQPHASGHSGSQQHHNSSMFYSTSSNARTSAAPPRTAAAAAAAAAASGYPSAALTASVPASHPMDWEPPPVATPAPTPCVAATGTHHPAWQPSPMAGGHGGATQPHSSMQPDMQAEQPLLRQPAQQGEQEGLQEEAAAGQSSGRFRRLLPQLMRTLGRCGHGPSSSG